MENLKQLWNQYDTELKASRQLNERLLGRLLEEKTAGRLGRMAQLEYLNLALCVVLAIVLLCTPHLLRWNVFTAVCYATGLIAIATGLGWGWHKLQLLSRLEPGERTVTEMMQELQEFRLLLQKEKIVALLVMPAIILALMEVAWQLIRHESLTGQLQHILVRLLIAYPFVVLVTIVLYRRYYFEPIRTAMKHLAELREFERD